MNNRIVLWELLKRTIGKKVSILCSGLSRICTQDLLYKYLDSIAMTTRCSILHFVNQKGLCINLYYEYSLWLENVYMQSHNQSVGKDSK